MSRIAVFLWCLNVGCTGAPTRSSSVAKPTHPDTHEQRTPGYSEPRVPQCGKFPELGCWPKRGETIAMAGLAGTLEQRFCHPLQFIDPEELLVMCAGSHDAADRGTLGRLRSDGTIRWSIPWPVTSLEAKAVPLGADRWVVARSVPVDTRRAADGHQALFTGRQVAEVVAVGGNGSVSRPLRFESTMWSQIRALSSGTSGIAIGGTFKGDLAVRGTMALRSVDYFAGFVATLSPDRATARWVTAIGGRDSVIVEVAPLTNGGVGAIGIGRDTVVAGRHRLVHSGYFWFYARFDSSGSIEALERLDLSNRQAGSAPGPSDEVLAGFIDGSFCTIDGATGKLRTVIAVPSPDGPIIEVRGATREGTRSYAVPRKSNSLVSSYDLIEIEGARIVASGTVREHDAFYGSLQLFFRMPDGLVFVTGNLVADAAATPYAFASLRAL